MNNNSVLTFIIKKVIRFTSLLFALCALSFVLISNSPIDPVKAYIGADMMNVGPEQRAKIEQYWGLDKPAHEQFLSWASAVARGDLGDSKIYRRPVIEIISERFTASLLLMGTAWTISGILGFILGIVSALKRGSWIDKVIKWYCFILASTPTFWLGLLLLIVFVVWLGILPIGLAIPAGVLKTDVTLADKFMHFILPALTLSILGVANMAMHTRTKLIEVLNSDYVLFAKARGESDWEIVKNHGIRNIALPAITLQFAYFGELFGGSILAEKIFSYPGLGSAITEAGLRGDVPLLLGIVLFSAIFVFSGNLIADILYKVVDPRMRGISAS